MLISTTIKFDSEGLKNPQQHLVYAFLMVFVKLPCCKCKVKCSSSMEPVNVNISDVTISNEATVKLLQTNLEGELNFDYYVINLRD